jgi:hypothetical protein
MRTIQIPPSLILVDHLKNFSRTGKPHLPERVQELAECLLTEGQRTPIEVYALAYVDGAEDTPETRARGVERRGRKKSADGYGLVAGYRRVQAALLLAEQGLRSEHFDGTLTAVVVEITEDTDRERRNLSENVEHDHLTPIDEAHVLQRLTADPPDGHGETLEGAVKRLRLRGGVARGRTLLRLLALTQEAQEYVRQNHYDPELGINVDTAVRLSGRAAEVQAGILAASKDGAGRVTPKSVRMSLAPKQGRAGQPTAPSGAQLTRWERHLEQVARDPERLRRADLSEREARLLIGTCRLLRGEDVEGALTPALARLLGSGLRDTARVVDVRGARSGEDGSGDRRLGDGGRLGRGRVSGDRLVTGAREHEQGQSEE